VDLRCNGRLHGKLDDGIIEVSCKSRFCGWEPGIVVLHRFSAVNGELTETRRYKSPGRMNATHDNPASVRSA
jgi:hypothetical protein